MDHTTAPPTTRPLGHGSTQYTLMHRGTFQLLLGNAWSCGAVLQFLPTATHPCFLNARLLLFVTVHAVLR